ncbi:MAG: T9SS type A sorting domain-containing protein [Saprospiraceae bacterium]
MEKSDALKKAELILMLILMGYTPGYRKACDSVWIEIKNSVEDLIVAYVAIFPNPASEHISIVFPEDYLVEKCQIFDIMGRLIKDKISNFENIDISDLNQGMYFIKTRDRNEKIAIGKFVVE